MSPTTKQKDTERTAAQYEAQLQGVIAKWATKALETLAEDVAALDRPGAPKIEPRPSAALQRTLGTFAVDTVRGWVVLPPRPKVAEYPAHVPSPEDIRRAEQRARIEAGAVHTFDHRRHINEDRARSGLPPLPPEEEE